MDLPFECRKSDVVSSLPFEVRRTYVLNGDGGFTGSALADSGKCRTLV